MHAVSFLLFFLKNTGLCDDRREQGMTPCIPTQGLAHLPATCGERRDVSTG